MNCKNIQNIIATDYVDGRLSGDERSMIKSHLEVCEDCKAYYETVLKTAILPIQGVEKKSVPGDLYSKVLRKIRETEQKPSIFELLHRRAIAIPAVSFAVAVILTLGLYNFGFIGESPQVKAVDGFESMTYIYNGDNGFTENGESSVSFGSGIEEYFL